MLISFSVANFRSVGEEQTLNLVSSRKISDHPKHLVPIDATGEHVVRAAIMYGANAAGKSNFVKAMKFAQSMIVAGEGRLGLAAPRFRFDSKLMSAPSTFEFRFLTDGRVFTYGFDVEGHDIRQEWLTVLSGDEDRVVFERDRDGKTLPAGGVASLFPDDTALESLLGALAQLPLTSHQLLLNRVATLPKDAQSTTLRNVLRWLGEDLLILLPDFRSFDILDRLSEDEEFRKLSEELLNAVGTGIQSLELSEEEIDAEIAFRRGATGRRLGLVRRGYGLFDDTRPKADDPSRVIRRRLLAVHPSSDTPRKLPFSEESDGTIQLLHLMPVLASIPKGAKIVVIDELDRSLHPLICWEFIRLFSETAPAAHKQLIVTTHEAHLLNQELLRRDEYWFVEKDASQQTRLVSLSDFKIRNDVQIEKGYLHGRFGGIPLIGSMAEIEKLLNPSVLKESICPDDSAR